MSSCSTRWLSELLPSELTLARETEREPDAEPTRPPLLAVVLTAVDEDATMDEDASIVSSVDPLLIKCCWTVGTCRAKY